MRFVNVQSLSMVDDLKPLSIIKVQLCFVRDAKVHLLEAHLAEGTTIAHALDYFQHAEESLLVDADMTNTAIAIYGKKKELDCVLRDQDRIEICGALIATPMDARRLRAKREHKSGKM